MRAHFGTGRLQHGHWPENLTDGSRSPTTLLPAGPGSEGCCHWSALSPVVGLVTFLFRPQAQVQCAVLTPRGGCWKLASGPSPVLAMGQASVGSPLNHICLGDFWGSSDLGQKVAVRINRSQHFYGAFSALGNPAFPVLLIFNTMCGKVGL